MKITQVFWFTDCAGQTIGIVLGETEIFHKKVAYIGVGFGINEEHDINHIKSWGAKFPIETAEALVKGLTPCIRNNTAENQI